MNRTEINPPAMILFRAAKHLLDEAGLGNHEAVRPATTLLMEKVNEIIGGGLCIDLGLPEEVMLRLVNQGVELRQEDRLINIKVGSLDKFIYALKRISKSDNACLICGKIIEGASCPHPHEVSK